MRLTPTRASLGALALGLLACLALLHSSHATRSSAVEQSFAPVGRFSARPLADHDGSFSTLSVAPSSSDAKLAPFGSALTVSFDIADTPHQYNVTLLPSAFTADALILIDGAVAYRVPPPTSYGSALFDESGAETGRVVVTLSPEDGSLVDATVVLPEETIYVQPTRRLAADKSLSASEFATLSASSSEYTSFSSADFPRTLASTGAGTADKKSGERVPFAMCGSVDDEGTVLDLDPLDSHLPHRPASAGAGAGASDGEGARRLLLSPWSSCIKGNYRLRTQLGLTHSVTAAMGGAAHATAFAASLVVQTNAMYSVQLGITLAVSRLLVCTTNTCDDGSTSITWNRAGNVCPSTGALVSSAATWHSKTGSNAGTSHVITDCFPAPGVVGMAQTSSVARYSSGGWTQFFRSTLSTFAHEIGHILGAPHPFPDSASQGTYGGLMDYGTDGRLLDSDPNFPGEMGFNIATDKNHICSTVNTSIHSTSTLYVTPRTMAWEPLGAVCGDGIVEGLEECDAGPNGSACCTETCRLTPGSRCATDDSCCVNCQPLEASTFCRAAFGPQGICSAGGRCVTSECMYYSNIKGPCGLDSNDPCQEKCQLDNQCSTFSQHKFNVPHGAYCRVPGSGAEGRCVSPTPLRYAPATCRPLNYTAEPNAGGWGKCVCSADSTSGTRTRALTCKEMGETPVSMTYCASLTDLPETEQPCTCDGSDDDDGDGSVKPYQWSVSAWSTCAGHSASCSSGQGTMTRNVTCMRVGDGGKVSDVLCMSDPRPTTESACPYSCTFAFYCSNPDDSAVPPARCASDTAFSACDAGCGTGTRRRKVQCIDSRGSVADMSKCSGAVPASTDTCSSFAKCEWVCRSDASKPFASCNGSSADEDDTFSACSSICGVGSQSRIVRCGTHGSNEVVATSYCSGTAPTASRTCSRDSCPSSWLCAPSATDAGGDCGLESSWGECSSLCSNGTSTRAVSCVTITGLPASDCPEPAPPTQRACAGLSECTELPFYRCGSFNNPVVCRGAGPGTGEADEPAGVSTQWSECSGGCGVSSQRRHVFCMFAHKDGGSRVLNPLMCEAAGIPAPPRRRYGCKNPSSSATIPGSPFNSDPRYIADEAAAKAEGVCTPEWRCFSPSSTGGETVPCSSADASSTGADWGSCPPGECSVFTEVRRRGVGCFDMANPSAPRPIAASFCSSSSQPTDRSPCPSNDGCVWRTGPWIGCPSCLSSSAFGNGTMIRSVTCGGYRASDGAETSSRPDTSCAHLPRPDSSAPCEDTQRCSESPSGVFYHAWRQTFGPCAKGCTMQVRHATVVCCRTSSPGSSAACLKVVSDAYCSSTRPATTDQCFPPGLRCGGNGVCATTIKDYDGTKRIVGTCTCNPGYGGPDCAYKAQVSHVAVDGLVDGFLVRGETVRLSFNYTAPAPAPGADDSEPASDGAGDVLAPTTIEVFVRSESSTRTSIGSVSVSRTVSSSAEFFWTVPFSLPSGIVSFVVTAGLAAESSSSPLRLENPCTQRPGFCGAHGTCSASSGVGATCTCVDGWMGERCSERVCVVAGCNLMGTKSCKIVTEADSGAAPTTKSVCSCKDGFSGPTCHAETRCTTRSEGITPRSCANGGLPRTLSDTEARPTIADGAEEGICRACSCVGGWSGADCSVCALRCSGRDISGPFGAPASDCRSCACNDGYYGEQCQCRGVLLTLSYTLSRTQRVTNGGPNADEDSYTLSPVWLAGIARALETAAGGAVPGKRAGQVRFLMNRRVRANGIKYEMLRFILEGFCEDLSSGAFKVLGAESAYASEMDTMSINGAFADADEYFLSDDAAPASGAGYDLVAIHSAGGVVTASSPSTGSGDVAGPRAWELWGGGSSYSPIAALSAARAASIGGSPVSTSYASLALGAEPIVPVDSRDVLMASSYVRAKALVSVGGSVFAQSPYLADASTEHGLGVSDPNCRSGNVCPRSSSTGIPSGAQDDTPSKSDDDGLPGWIIAIIIVGIAIVLVLLIVLCCRCTGVCCFSPMNRQRKTSARPAAVQMQTCPPPQQQQQYTHQQQQQVYASAPVAPAAPQYQQQQQYPQQQYPQQQPQYYNQPPPPPNPPAYNRPPPAAPSYGCEAPPAYSSVQPQQGPPPQWGGAPQQQASGGFAPPPTPYRR